MKKMMKGMSTTVCFLLTVMMLFVLLACGQSKMPKIEEITGARPDWYKDTAPQGVLWGLGSGDLSTVDASCEQALLIAQGNIVRKIISNVRNIESSYDNTPLGNAKKKADIYHNYFYMLLNDYLAEQASFELSKYTTVERRGKTSDGKIWYVVSIKSSDVAKIEPAISKYLDYNFNLFVEGIEAILEE
jgi:hypothetical protein